MFIDNYLATVTPFAGSKAPTGWMLCQGQSIPINGNESLFSLITTTYGGDGFSAFNLPDFKGRAAKHCDVNGSNLFPLGAKGGNEKITLNPNQLPIHSHTLASMQATVVATSATGTVDTPAGNIPAAGQTVYSKTADGVSMGRTSMNLVTPNAGKTQPFDIRSPYQAMNFIICTEGIFPSRS